MTQDNPLPPGAVSAPLIPFNRAGLRGTEFAYMQESVGHLCGDGPFTRRSERLLEEITGAKRALLTPSCTAALEMTALLLDLQPGDEVIVPSFTFVSTVNAYVLRGARPTFCDIREDTLNLDESKLAALITPRTKAVVPVHYAGVACEMDAILSQCNERGVAVIEDNAHGLFGTYKGRPLGSLGAMATQSFHETKNITCGEGGALLINDPRYCERAEILREKGTNRSRFFRGQVDKYTWVDVGSSNVPSEICSAFLYGQLEMLDEIAERRRRIYQYYRQHLKPLEAEGWLRVPRIPEDCDSNFHLFFLLLPDLLFELLFVQCRSRPQADGNGNLRRRFNANNQGLDDLDSQFVA